MSKSEHAVEQFMSGLNCAQAVVAEFAEDLGMDVDSAGKTVCGFGGGMGWTASTCGVITGAIVVIGLAACGPSPRDLASKNRAYELVRSFIDEFRAEHDAVECRELLGCDISTPEGYAEVQRSDLFQTRCSRFVGDAVEILEDILEDVL